MLRQILLRWAFFLYFSLCFITNQVLYLLRFLLQLTLRFKPLLLYLLYGPSANFIICFSIRMLCLSTTSLGQDILFLRQVIVFIF
mmetsp:Transcript_24181/g.37193  ORF Transcript_24181/g.37193 Transcript_24181/m.37193 type:complete len:85 (-) Transcript_24181:3553-3807(-)